MPGETTVLRNLAETLGEASVNKKFESLAQSHGFLIALTDCIAENKTLLQGMAHLQGTRA